MPKTEHLTTPHTLYPQTRILSNGHYAVLLDNAGNGFSIFDREIALTRWREDLVSGQHGLFIFIRDLDDGKLWSVAYQPTCIEPESYEVLYSPDKVEYVRRDFEILLHTEIAVSPKDNVELRKVKITNLSKRKRNLEITSYAEVALANQRGDLMHPAFAKMFVESEYNSDFNSLIFSRRPRSKTEERLYLMHMLTTNTTCQPTQFESSRMHFLGRGKNISAASVFNTFEKLSGTVGEILDPICSLRTRVEVQEGQTEFVVFTTGFARTYQEISNLAQSYHDSHSVTHAFEMAWSNSNVELCNDRYTINQINTFQRLVTTLFYNVDKVRGKQESLQINKLTQSALWRFGISGDLPIVLLRIKDQSEVKLALELLLSHQYIRTRGVSFDLLIVNECQSEYLQTIQEELELLIRSDSWGNLVDKKGGIYLRAKTQLSNAEITLLETVARAVFVGSMGTMSSQLNFEGSFMNASIKPKNLSSAASLEHLIKEALPKNESLFYNGTGGFVNDGKSYQIEIENGKLPPLPWSNVIANPNFGFLVTESGGGYTWAENSRENKITPWCNDPVSDLSGEVIYIRDIETAEFWSPTPKPVLTNANYRVTHTFGKSQFVSHQHGVNSKLEISGSPIAKVKWWQLELENETATEKKLEVFLYVDWVLGVSREENYRYLVTNFDKEHDFLHVSNNYNNEFAGRSVLIGANLELSTYTSSKFEFIGRHHTTEFPQVFETSGENKGTNFLASSNREKIELKQKVGAGFDACGVIKVEIVLAPSEKRELLFYLAQSDSLVEAKHEVAKFRSLNFRAEEFVKVKEQIDSILSAVQVRTPDKSFDILMNGWLLYQTLYCRLYARSAFYQSGGAFGFRDQLQDVMALLYSRSDITREQIILHASRQFPEGDVQHWWHPPTGRGVRTHISDDYLWMPYVVSRYLEVTSDYSLLDEQAGFIDGEKLAVRQHDSYFMPQQLSKFANVYEHCTLALDHALVFGSNGLPLMGGGDWNDGMNEVGIEGKGESVWLAWFLSDCLDRFSKIAEERNDQVHAKQYAEKAKELIAAIDANAWDGEWYRRAYFDDGTPLGSKDNDECKIDSLSQSWAVIVGKGDAKRRKMAMDSLRRELVNKNDKIICLLTPPFHDSALEPGYIKGYLSGIRENGGQYTHAAAWVVMATVIEGRGKEALDLFSLINPINHTSTEQGVLKYQGEPYVLAGDVYSTPSHVGRAGWSWYTGSAGWMYQVGLEHILGLKVRGSYFTIEPVIPPEWREFSIIYQHRDKQNRSVKYEILVTNPAGVESGVKNVEVDGRIISDKKINFIQGEDNIEKTVKVSLIMGR